MFNILNIFKDTCNNYDSDDNNDATDTFELLLKEQKLLTEPIYDINNQTDVYVQIFDNVLLPEECKTIIKLFNKHSNKQYIGKTMGAEKDIHFKAKKTKEINITDLSSENEEFAKIDALLYNGLRLYLNKYMLKIKEKVNTPNVDANNIIDTGYQIQKYKKNTGYYINHVDPHIYRDSAGIHNRIITYIWYLNDISEGGETNFVSNFKIKPVAGRLLLFPSTWSYPHAGLVPISSDKYIVTGWIYQNTN